MPGIIGMVEKRPRCWTACIMDKNIDPAIRCNRLCNSTFYIIFPTPVSWQGKHATATGLLDFIGCCFQIGLISSADHQVCAFTCQPGIALPSSIWLVDDVVTTRSTLEASGQALRDAGAEQVAAVCLARTAALQPPDGHHSRRGSAETPPEPRH